MTGVQTCALPIYNTNTKMGVAGFDMISTAENSEYNYSLWSRRKDVEEDKLVKGKEIRTISPCLK